jgi:hypothetical protein
MLAAANVVDVDFLRRLQAGLGDPMMDDEALRERLGANFALLERFARTWQSIAAERNPALGASMPTESGQGAALLDVGPLRLTPAAVAVR